MKILFVCTGNTCRSAMAEAIFNRLCPIDGIEAVSAGLSIVKGSTASRHAVTVVKEDLDMNISGRKAVQFTSDTMNEADLVLTMTSYMRDLLIREYPSRKNKIYSLHQYVGAEGDVTDPYGGDLSVYSETFNILKSDILLLIDKLKEDVSIN